MTIISYLIVIIFNQGIEKNDASERGCQTESTQCPRSKVLFDLCVKRWVENLDGFSMFLVTLPFIGTNCIWRNIKNGENET